MKETVFGLPHLLLALALPGALCWNVAHAGEMNGLRVEAGATGTRAELAVPSGTSYKLISLANPHRLVVDLPGVELGKALKMPVPAGLVKAIRTGHPVAGTTRVVFDLAFPVTVIKPRFENAPGGSRLVLEWPGDGGDAIARIAASPAAPGPTSASMPAATAAPARSASDAIVIAGERSTPTPTSTSTSTSTAPAPALAPPSSEAEQSAASAAATARLVASMAKPPVAAPVASTPTPAPTSAVTPRPTPVSASASTAPTPQPPAPIQQQPPPASTVTQAPIPSPAVTVPPAALPTVTTTPGTIATGVPTRIATGVPTPMAGALPESGRPVDAVPSAPRRSLMPGVRPLVVAIDPGHGGQDPGAIGLQGKREKDVTLAIGRELARQINATPGLKAFMTRDSDVFIALPRRAQLARAAKADIFVSIHADAAENRNARGSSVYVLSLKGASSQRARWLADKENSADLIGGRVVTVDNTLASVLLDLTQSGHMKASEDAADHVLTGLRRVGNNHKPQIERANFAVLRTSDMPSMLVETAFISNPEEERRLTDPAAQRELARAILGGIDGYFQQQPPPGTMYATRATASGAGSP